MGSRKDSLTGWLLMKLSLIKCQKCQKVFTGDFAMVNALRHDFAECESVLRGLEIMTATDLLRNEK